MDSRMGSQQSVVSLRYVETTYLATYSEANVSRYHIPKDTIWPKIWIKYIDFCHSAFAPSSGPLQLLPHLGLSIYTKKQQDMRNYYSQKTYSSAN